MEPLWLGGECVSRVVLPSVLFSSEASHSVQVFSWPRLVSTCGIWRSIVAGPTSLSSALTFLWLNTYSIYTQIWKQQRTFDSGPRSSALRVVCHTDDLWFGQKTHTHTWMNTHSFTHCQSWAQQEYGATSELLLFFQLTGPWCKHRSSRPRGGSRQTRGDRQVVECAEIWRHGDKRGICRYDAYLLLSSCLYQPTSLPVSVRPSLVTEASEWAGFSTWGITGQKSQASNCWPANFLYGESTNHVTPCRKSVFLKHFKFFGHFWSSLSSYKCFIFFG